MNITAIKKEGEEYWGKITSALFTFHIFKRPNGFFRSVPEPEPHRLFTEPVTGEPAIVAKFESSSRPGKFHQVFRLSSGKLYCTCIGYATHSKCWHIEQATRKEDNKQ